MIRKCDEIIEILKRKILDCGAISLSEYMEICLTHPKYGYYIRNTPIGAKGDFTTSPEISQMFGELIGLWIAKVWIDHNKPDKFSLVELGPGNGTLMVDILRATQIVDGLHSALDLILIDISPNLQKIQKKALKDFPVKWKTKISDLPNQPTIIVANEFFDALPISQFKRKSNQWMEVMVTMKDPNTKDSDEFCFQLMKTNNKLFDDLEMENISEGDIIEFSKMMKDSVCYLSEHIQQNSGTALIIDYGKEGNVGNTLQSVQQHCYSNPLKCPGQMDLTSFVDFNAIRSYAEGFELIVPNLTCQRDFLKALGIEQRAKILSRNLSGDKLGLHQTALERLIGKDSMGHLFKVLGLRSKNFPPLAGLEI